VTENYLDAIDVDEFREIADRCEGKRLMVIDRNSEVDNLTLVEDERRVSDLVELGPYQRKLNEIVGKAFIELTNYHIGRELDWYERPQLLRYSAGGFYVKHADSENMNPELRTWSKTIDRDLSLLIYLNEDYEGGELFFEKFNYTLRPKAGMAVLFPSDNRYLHEARTITSGQRYAIVSWASAKGVSKISKKPPQSAIMINK
jgi:predicted 2-oxoglutarate/Fe(II)-dependent dioxygenase YbiX